MFAQAQSLPFSDDFSTNTGWTGLATGQWAIGAATAGGGASSGNPDPGTDTSPSSDNKILGFNIGGDYLNNLSALAVTSPAINCTGQSTVQLSFQRWLNVEESRYDKALIQVSSNGTSYTTIWTNPSGSGANIADGAWSLQTYDISSAAANQATVTIRFVMGSTDSSVVYSGWNIDDLVVKNPVSPPPQASGPSPAHQATGISQNTTLSWASAPTATSYDVYLGTTSPLGAAHKVGTAQTAASFTPATALSLSTTYYWRVDAANASGTTTGTEWSFTVASSPAPGSSSGPTPANGAAAVPITQALSWSAASAATSYDVYLGTTSPLGGSALQGNQTATSFTPATLAAGTVYYWRVDAKNTVGTTQGPEWSFTTQGPAVGWSDDFGSGGGWTLNGAWSIGSATAGGGGGGSPDPATDTSPSADNKILGYAIGGDYANNLGEVHATSPAIDCSAANAVELHFQRYLGVESSAYDHAYVRMSLDGISWSPVWDNSSVGASLAEGAWSSQKYTLAGAAGKSKVYVRFTMGTTDSSVTYCGWNIDDVAIIDPTAPPPPVTGPNPADGAIDVALTPTFSWGAVPGAVSYDLYLGQAPGLSSGVGSTHHVATITGTGQAPPPTSYAIGTALTAGVTYYWRVDASSQGPTPTPSAEWRFTTLPPPPPQAGNPKPAHLAANVLRTGLSLACSPVATATSYNIFYLATTTPPSATPVLNGAHLVASGAASPSYTPPTAPALGATVYWRVDAINSAGSSTGSEWQFTVVTQDPPGAATAPSPTHTAAGVSTAPTLSWTAPATGTTTGAATGYDVYFGATSPLTATQRVATGQAATSLTPAGPLQNGKTYFWRVDPRNAGGTTTGAEWFFTTLPSAPTAAATTPTPPNGATGIPLSQSLNWAPVTGATSYDVFFSTTTPIPAGSSPQPSVFQVNQTSTTWTPPPLTVGATYYWRIDARNAGGSFAGTEWSFTTTSTAAAPSRPVLLAPANAAGNVAANQSFSWQATPGAAGYDVYLGQVSGVGGQTAFRIAQGLTATTFTPTSGLTANKTHYWQVHAVNGNGSTASLEWSFTTAPLPLGTLSVSAGVSNPGAGTETPTITDLPVLQMRLTAAVEDIAISACVVSVSGSGNDVTAISRVRLFLDVNGDGALDAGDSQLGADQTFSADNGSVTFSSLGRTITVAAPQTWLVVADLNAAIGDSFTFACDPATGITAVGVTSALSISAGGSTVTGGMKQVSNVGSLALAASTSAVTTDFVTPGSAEKTMMRFSLGAGSVEDVLLTGLTISDAGSAAISADVQAVALYVDANGDGVIDIDEKQKPLASSLAFASGQTSLAVTGLGRNIAVQETLRLILVYDISAQAPPGGTLAPGIAITSATGLQSGLEVTRSGSPLSGATFHLQSPVVIGTAALNDATQLEAYSAVLSASGGSGTYTWSFQSVLPAGVTPPEAMTGVDTITLSGTPTASGLFEIVVVASDTLVPSHSAQQTLSLAIKQAAPKRPVIPPPATSTETQVCGGGVGARPALAEWLFATMAMLLTLPSLRRRS